MIGLDLRARLREGPNLRSVRPRRIETTLALTSARGGPRPSLTVPANEENLLETHAGVTMRPVQRGETRDPDDLGLWRGAMPLVREHRPLPASSLSPRRTRSAFENPTNGRSRCVPRSSLAEDSLSERRSVAPLGAFLAFGEIGRRRFRVGPSGAPRSTEWTPRSHAWPRGSSCVSTHPLSSCIAARARPHHHDSRVIPRSTQAGLLVTSRPRDFSRGPMAGGSGSALPKQNGAPCRPTSAQGVGLRSGAKDPEGLRRASLWSLTGRPPR